MTDRITDQKRGFRKLLTMTLLLFSFLGVSGYAATSYHPADQATWVEVVVRKDSKAKRAVPLQHVFPVGLYHDHSTAYFADSYSLLAYDRLDDVAFKRVSTTFCSLPVRPYFHRLKTIPQGTEEPPVFC